MWALITPPNIRYDAFFFQVAVMSDVYLFFFLKFFPDKLLNSSQFLLTLQPSVFLPWSKMMEEEVAVSNKMEIPCWPVPVVVVDPSRHISGKVHINLQLSLWDRVLRCGVCTLLAQHLSINHTFLCSVAWGLHDHVSTFTDIDFLNIFTTVSTVDVRRTAFGTNYEPQPAFAWMDFSPIRLH